MEDEHFTSPGLIGFDRIPVHQVVIDLDESSNKVCESGTGRSWFWSSTSSIHARSAGCAATLHPVNR
jgi:hypothetical protein